MYNFEQFAEKYKTLENYELLEILNNREQYQPIAIEAAQQELTSRNLQAEEMIIAEQVVSERLAIEQKKKERSDLFKQKINKSVNKVYGELNPILDEAPGIEKLIRVIAIVYGVIFVYRFFGQLRFLSAIVSGKIEVDYGYSFYLFPLLILIPTVIYFWKKTLLGWVLLCGYCCFFLPIEIYFLYYSFSYYFQSADVYNFVPRSSIISLLVNPALYISTLFLLFKKDMIRIFKVGVDWKNGVPILFFLIGVSVLIFFL